MYRPLQLLSLRKTTICTEKYMINISLNHAYHRRFISHHITSHHITSHHITSHHSALCKHTQEAKYKISHQIKDKSSLSNQFEGMKKKQKVIDLYLLTCAVTGSFHITKSCVSGFDSTCPHSPPLRTAVTPT
jgi:hypothetical protein